MSCPLSSPCPEPTRLQDLLDAALTDEERAALTAHLDVCEECAQLLEELAAGGTELLQAAAHIDRDRPPAHSAYWTALKKVESAVALAAPSSYAATRAETPLPAGTDPSRPLPLNFLQPSENDEYLGQLGTFSIVSIIGRGGMGVVLRAHDRCLKRYVAIKVLSPELAHNENARQRFCREARAAAAVTHENVVAIHQVDREETTGIPFLVMQLVNGESLEDRIARGPLALKEILHIGAQAAAGLHAAHTQGLIHRDVKPANILLEGNPPRVRLTDFGLARAAEDVHLTQTGFTPGTPLYMAPEQARGEPIDHRADLFSLGSVLYVMCTGRPPFQGSTPYAVLKGVTEEVPTPIAQLNPEVPGWLIDVIDRLHAKSPADRYASAAEVAEVLSSHLNLLQHPSDLQVACRTTGVGRALRQAGPLVRSRLTWLAAGLLLGSVGTLGAVAALGNPFARPVVAVEAPTGPTPRAELNARVGPIWSSAYAPDGATLATALDDGTVKLWDVATESVRYTVEAHKGPIWSIAIAPDGQQMATSSDDGIVKVWDVATRQERHRFVHPTAVRGVAFAPDGKTLMTGSRNGMVRFWDIDTEREKFPVKEAAHGGIVMAVAFSPDGRTAASAGSDKLVKLWDVASGQVKLTLAGHTASVYTVSFSCDGRRLATGGWDRTVRVWDMNAGDCLRTLTGHTLDVWSVAFAPDCRTLASGSEDRTVKLWDSDTGRELATLPGHGSTVYSVTFAPDGLTLASGGREGVVRLWNVLP